jgi:ABC-type polysaccharide/polyol phosphate export permease
MSALTAGEEGVVLGASGARLNAVPIEAAGSSELSSCPGKIACAETAMPSGHEGAPRAGREPMSELGEPLSLPVPPPSALESARAALMRSSARGAPRSAHIAGMTWTLIRTDFKVRYHGSIGGFVWALLKPVSMFVVLLGVFSLIFTPTDPNYRPKLILGLFLWEFFSEGTKVGLLSLYSKGYLLTKTRFPRSIIVITSGVNAIIALAVFTLAMLLHMAVWGRLPSPQRLLLFATFVIDLWIMVVGFSLATSVLYLRYRDLNHLWDAITQAGFFLAPIVYPIEVLPAWARPYLYLWPPTPVVEYSRQVLIDGQIPGIDASLSLMAMALSVLGVGVLLFRRYAPRAAEQL